ncbi:DUF1127 domain-containing protein [Endozoicomonas atrinae]|uniref:DUF1127 domain-containing protein n=1 Tax=Endozoicomonas atrinae TaxID=1333660 RepID=UPI003B00FD39
MDTSIAGEFSYLDLSKKIVGKLKSVIITWKVRAQSRKHLAEMDSRLLNDIGLTEADRSQEVIKPFWQE